MDVAEAFQICYVAWVAALIEVPEGVVAIDGKTMRRSKGAAKNAIHMVSAFAPALGQVKMADKASEVVAIPKLLHMLAIEADEVADKVMRMPDPAPPPSPASTTSCRRVAPSRAAVVSFAARPADRRDADLVSLLAPR